MTSANHPLAVAELPTGGAADRDATHAGVPGRTVRIGAWWGLASQVAIQILSMVATLVLARLLMPSDFGIIAICGSILSLVSIGLALGWEPSVVRRRDLDDRYLSTLFWTALGLGVLASAGTMLSAPLITGALGLPAATPYVQVLALSLIPHLARTVPSGLLMRAFRYRSQYTIQALGMLLYVVVQIALATAGAGVWSVVVGQLSQSLFLATSSLIVAGWRPRLLLDLGRLRGEVGFASGNLSTQVTTFGVKNVDYWIIAATLGASALGAYYIAYVLPSILRMRLTQVAQNVLLPVFARAENFADRRRIYREVILLQVGVGFPAMAAVAVLAEPVTSLFFGAKWEDVVAPMRWLAIVALLDIPGAILAPIAIVGQGLPRLLVVQVLRLTVTAAGVGVAAAAWGTLEAVAVAVVVGAAVGAVAHQALVAAHVKVGFATIRTELLAVSVTTAVMAVPMVALARLSSNLPDIVTLMACAFTGALTYVAVGWLVFRRTFQTLFSSVRRMVRP